VGEAEYPLSNDNGKFYPYWFETANVAQSYTWISE
jgi:hypothetical protein